MTTSTPAPLATPFQAIFADRAEAEWAFMFLRRTLDLLNTGTNGYRPCALTLPKNHKRRLLRLNFGPWLLIDFCGPHSQYGKRINLALLTEGCPAIREKQWFVFNYPYDWRGGGVYCFSWAEIQQMDEELAAHYVASMHYIGGLFGKWQGSPYRLAHQPHVFAAIFDPQVRATLLTKGINPLFGAEKAQ